ncbi:aspartate/glutamate racemase family protein [Breoghania sp. L-A4]|uniref:aspartate/glutamate racemase family protein n=1 Tax=Breoghania sp. L-A4 TaxID=2304600 RepID=UPI000E35EABA|nr:aspartate/glutamate racemase family protein [Breoghania sp. L-A4]AXS42800.1 aspartate/glutamate racemase family protein [Breoghania sp. L-A4]
MPRVALLNPNTNAGTTAMMVGIARSQAPAGLTIEGLTAPYGAALITDEAALRISAEAVVGQAGGLAAFDGVIVSAYGDPGVEELRALLSVPVVGIAEASFEAAFAHGRFAVITTTPDLADAIRRRVAGLGYGRDFSGVFLTDGDVHAVMRDPDGLTRALALAGDAAIRAGAQALIVGGGPLGEAAEALAGRLGVPVIAPIRAAVDKVSAKLARIQLA